MTDDLLSKNLDNYNFVVLVVDDDANYRELIATYLSLEEYSVVELGSGGEAVDYCFDNDIDLVILDVMMPGKDGYQTCQEIKALPVRGILPVIMLTALDDKEEKMRAYNAGADDFLNKPSNRFEVLVRVKSLLRIRQLSLEMENIENVLFSMVKILEKRDPYTKGHSERVSSWSAELAARMNFSSIGIEKIRKGALLHDIGKIGIVQELLTLKRPLTDAEFAEIKRHPVIGQEICSPLQNLESIMHLIRSHHERLDGSGYPDGLKGAELPDDLRIVSVVDVFDALTSERPYRKALNPRQAFAVIQEEMEKGWWDEQVVYHLGQYAFGNSKGAKY